MFGQQLSKNINKKSQGNAVVFKRFPIFYGFNQFPKFRKAFSSNLQKDNGYIVYPQEYRPDK